MTRPFDGRTVNLEPLDMVDTPETAVLMQQEVNFDFDIEESPRPTRARIPSPPTEKIVLPTKKKSVESYEIKMRKHFQAVAKKVYEVMVDSVDHSSTVQADVTKTGVMIKINTGYIKNVFKDTTLWHQDRTDSVKGRKNICARVKTYIIENNLVPDGYSVTVIMTKNMWRYYLKIQLTDERMSEFHCREGFVII